ncbi:hypothetical protein D0Z00_002724 [Geotrichum galactomycetum]|uniref:Uncharacterized protein n=1 Tax=Geotrichum galactomycetum TaxID=27317 RepID=A0ACB6V3C7_9ASCO|nr:hypothetical protein D0Z00_002724 [Geotrichum candidum]
MALAAYERRNGLNGYKLARLAGAWAFEMVNSQKELPADFATGLSCWSVAAEASYHLFLAFLRSVYPDQNERYLIKFPRVLEQLLLKQAYPPKPMYKNRLITVPKITLSVGRLSANPFVLLQRISKTIQFENPAMFPSEDDFDTLYFLFSDINEIEKRMSPESKRILEEVSKENSIFTDNSLFIKDTPELPYDIRARTWSKHYNQAYIDPVTGEPHRPLTNYVYEDSQREMIMKSSSLPKAQRPVLPYPESPTLDGIKDKPIHIGTWEEVMHYYSKALGDKKKHSGETTKNRRITTDNLTTCTLSKVAIDDFFVWVWINSISPEQTEISKAQFGRSIVVELQVSDGEAGRRWVVVEEVLTPAPPPMKAKVKEAPPTPKPKAAATPKPKPSKPTEKKPVRFSEPKVLSPIPVKPASVAPTPQPKKEKTIHLHYDIDPLVAAVAEKLKIQSVDRGTQTDNDVPVRSNSRAESSDLHAISADSENSKGTQTYEYVDAMVSPPSSPHPKGMIKKRPVSSSSYVSEVQSIYVSPALGPTEPTTPVQPILRTSRSYEEVMNSLPYLATSPNRDVDYMVKPILSSDIPTNFVEVDLPPKVSVVVPDDLPEKASSPSNEDLFVPSIDTSFMSNRRVVSMPAYTAQRPLTEFVNSSVDSSIDSSSDSLDFTKSGYKALIEDEDFEETTTESFQHVPASSESHTSLTSHKAPSVASSHRSVSVPFPTNISSSARENPATMLRQGNRFNASTQQPHTSTFDHLASLPPPQPSSSFNSNPNRSSPESVGNNNNNSFRGSWGYGRTGSSSKLSQVPMAQAPPPPPPPPPPSLPANMENSRPRSWNSDEGFRQESRSHNPPAILKQSSQQPIRSSGSDHESRSVTSRQSHNSNYNDNPYQDQGRSNSFAGSGQHRLPPPTQQQQTPRGALPMIDQMMMDSGPMPGGLRSNVNFSARPARHSLPPPISRQTIPTTHHHHSSSEHNFDYGPDAGYRYDNFDRPKDSPDSGFANPPALTQQIRNQQNRQRRSSMAAHSSSDSDGSRTSFRSNSNRGDFGPPISNVASSNSQISDQTLTQPPIQQYQPPPAQGYAFVKTSPEIKAPQPRSGVTPMLFNENSMKTTSSSPTASATSLPRTEPVAIPPVVSAVNVGSQPFSDSGSSSFGDHSGFSSGKLPVIEGSPLPLETAFVEETMSTTSTSTSITHEGNYRAGNNSSGGHSRTSIGPRRTSGSFYSSSLPDGNKFDPTNEQSVERVANLLTAPPAPPAANEPVESTSPKKSSSIRVSQVMNTLTKLTKSKFGNKGSPSPTN